MATQRLAARTDEGCAGGRTAGPCRQHASSDEVADLGAENLPDGGQLAYEREHVDAGLEREVRRMGLEGGARQGVEPVDASDLLLPAQLDQRGPERADLLRRPENEERCGADVDVHRQEQPRIQPEQLLVHEVERCGHRGGRVGRRFGRADADVGHGGRSSLVGEISKGQGYKNLCIDVLQLVAIFQTSWGYLRGKTGIPWSDVERAEGLANELATLVGMRDRPSESPAGDLRRRAFSLLAHTYDDARRIVTYLRWKQGDYDRIAPSFYAARAVGRRRKSSSEPTLPPPASEDAVPVGLPGASPFASG